PSPTRNLLCNSPLVFSRVLAYLSLGRIAAMNAKTLVIVPTFNERDNLLPLVQRLLALPVEVELLVVDGKSTDGTAEMADELAAKHPQIHVFHETEKNG